ncbi:MAG: ATP-dependent helicase [Planctomycetales bacterium]|nr:ATP-dependent helicase [Planctomycetales bacterium]
MDFNEQQQAALSSTTRNLLVLAGAGTGKTRTIIGRASHLLSQGVEAKRLALLTFTRRSASEIRSRLGKTSGEAGTQVFAGTFHHFCLRIMSARRNWFGFEDLTVMDRDDQLQLMKFVRGNVVGKDSVIPQASQLLNYYSYARNTNQSPRAYLEKYTDHEMPVIEVMQKIFAAYRERKLANSYFDYDDILHRFAKVLHDNTEVRQKVAGQYDHVLVDEMQDTNPLQWLILENLGQCAHLFCVGDDAQSIYAFRGADFRNVHSFSQRLQHSQTLKLEENYRSTQEILDLANWLLERSKLNYDKKLRAYRGSGIKPQLVEFDSEFDEAEWVARAIVKRRQEGAVWNDHMVLCRTAYSARPLEAELIERKIPYRFIGGTSLLQMAHVRDLLSVLRVAVNHRDEIAWIRYLTLWPGIGEMTAAKLIQGMAQMQDLDQALHVIDAWPRNAPEVAETVRSIARHLEDPAQALQLLSEALDPLLDNKYDHWESRCKDFQLLEQLASRHRSISAFLERYTLDPISATEISRSPSDEIVTLITVHSAKGTEAKTCFVIGVQPGNYPHARSLGDESAIEEERRVLYVALTRAQDELILTRNMAKSYSRTSWNASTGSHYFLEGLPSKLISHQSLVGVSVQ